MKAFFKKGCMYAVLAALMGACVAEEAVQFRYNGGRNYSLVERTDLRRYDNNKYVGLLSREVRSFITNDGELYDGSFYVWQDTVRASVSVADGIRDSIPSRFRITRDGNLTMLEDHGFPSFRSFPAFTADKIRVGDSWQAKAVRAVDPLNKGIVTKIPMYVQYTYTGDEQVHGEDVYVLTAKWATRYGGGLYVDFGGDRELIQAQGSHNATMYVSKATGNAIVVRDAVNETFVYADGNSVSLKGTISLFTEYPPAVDRSGIIRALQRVAAITPEEAEDLAKPVTAGRGGAGSGSFGGAVTAGGIDEAVAAVPRPDLDNPRYEPVTDDQFDRSKERRPTVAKNTGSRAGGNATGNLGGKSIASSAGAAKPGKSNATSGGSATESAKPGIGTGAKNGAGIANGGASGGGGKGAGASKTSAAVEKAVASVQKPSLSEKPIKVENTSAGIRLTMQNLQFKADSAELLPGEKQRLDQIAAVLKEAPDCQFLVEGHTASTGYEEGEMRLSSQRAHAIAHELVLRGIQKERFICKGSGAHKPVADNTTAAGKAQNRRVEITILE